VIYGVPAEGSYADFHERLGTIIVNTVNTASR
jgi:hypothetical protein